MSSNRKWLGLNRVLCLSPHPDDIEYSMSATICKYPGTEFVIALLSYGTATDPTTSVKRLEEVRNFWTSTSRQAPPLILPVSTQDSYFSLKVCEQISEIEFLLGNIAIDAVVTPPSLDTHQEHVQTNTVALALTRHRPMSLIEYKTSSTLPEWCPSLYEQIGDWKINKLRSSFLSQLDSTYFTVEALEQFHKEFYVFKKEVKFVEMFKIKSLYQLTNTLPKTPSQILMPSVLEERRRNNIDSKLSLLTQEVK